MYFFIHSTLMSYEYAKLGILLLFSIFLSITIFLISIWLTNKNPDPEKLSTYECGFDNYEDARNVFDVRFYLMAILFLIFDLETVYFLPWCISYNHMSLQGFSIMLEFFIELFIGYIYAWRIGALNWN